MRPRYFKDFDVFGLTRYDDLFSTVLNVDIIRARSNKRSGLRCDFLGLGLHATEGNKGLRYLVLPLDIEVVRAGADYLVALGGLVGFFASEDKRH